MPNLRSDTIPFWKSLLIQLRSRNKILYHTSLYSLLGALLCLVLMITTRQEILGVNAFLKPFKFFLSASLACGTLGWILVYLKRQRAVKIYSWVTMIALVIELVLISFQAARGRISHYNVATVEDMLIFQVMGLAIVVFTLWTGWMTFLFFKQKEWPIWMTDGYLWGMRLGLLFFFVFALEGMHMVYLNQHTIGAADGSEGLPLVNWSRSYGDLRIPHFFGLHTLQILPLAGYYFFPKKSTMIIMAITWLGFIALLYWQAIKGLPIIP